MSVETTLTTTKRQQTMIIATSRMMRAADLREHIAQGRFIDTIRYYEVVSQ